MDPRTFLPATRVAMGPAPAPGEPAPDLAGERWSRPTVVAFLRHVGCPFAEATFVSLSQQARDHPQVRFVAVSHAPEPAAAEWCEAVAGAPAAVELVIDETRALYGRWGLGRGSLGHFLGRRSLGAVARLSRQGIHNRHPVGTRWQTAGTFAVDTAGIVRFAHLPAHAGDLPDLERARRAVSSAEHT